MAFSADLGKVVGSRIHFIDTDEPDLKLGIPDDWAFNTDSGKLWEKIAGGYLEADKWLYRGTLKGAIETINGKKPNPDTLDIGIGPADVGAASKENILSAAADYPGAYTLLEDKTGGYQSGKITAPENGYIYAFCLNDAAPGYILVNVRIGFMEFRQALHPIEQYDSFSTPLLKVKKGQEIVYDLKANNTVKIIFGKEVI